MALHRLLFPVLLTAALAGCSGEAFVDRNYMSVGARKEKLPGTNDGSITVCYTSDTPQARRDELAREACAAFGLDAVLATERRWQCRLTAPHLANYRCIDPAMRFSDGRYANPFSKDSVERWKAEQAGTSSQGRAAGTSP
jgi:hypothetical protein